MGVMILDDKIVDDILLTRYEWLDHTHNMTPHQETNLKNNGHTTLEGDEVFNCPDTQDL